VAADEQATIALELRNLNKFLRDTRAASAGMRQLERQNIKTGGSFRLAGNHGFWFNQAMFTIRRTVYGLTLAVAGLGTAAALMGLQFNNTMEQNTLAFTRFLGSAQKAQKELDFLFVLAARTPFEFPQLVDATRKFLAFGFTLEETNSLLQLTADAVAGFGLSAEAIDRAVLALGQMRSAGRVLGQDLRQLQELGLFNPEDFIKRTGIRREDLGSIGELMMPSEFAIDAITAYWRDQFGGASADFAKTFQGQLTSLRDYGGQAFGQMTEPLFTRMSREFLPLFVKITKDAGRAFDEGGFEAMFASIDRNLGRGTNLADLWRDLSKIGANLIDIVMIMASAFLFAWNVLAVGDGIFLSLGIVTGILADVLRLFEPILGPLIALWILHRTALLLNVAATKSKIFWDKLEILWGKRKGTMLKILLAWRLRDVLWTNLQAIATLKLVQMWRLLTVTGRLLAIMFLRLGIAMLTNPLFLAIFLVGLLAGAFYILYQRSERVRNAVDKMVTTFKDLNKTFGEMGDKLTFLGMKFEDFQDPFNLWGRVPGLAAGGTITRSGLAMVGEHGRELLRLPVGAQVQPLAHGAMNLAGQFPEYIQVDSEIILDGRQIAEATAKHQLSRSARQ
jgi:tape measure domain-containing protein